MKQINPIIMDFNIGDTVMLNREVPKKKGKKMIEKGTEGRIGDVLYYETSFVIKIPGHKATVVEAHDLIKVN